MFFTGLKEKSLSKAIQKARLSTAENNAVEGSVRSLALIIDYDTLVDYKPLLDIAKAIHVKNEHIYVAGYVAKVYPKVNYMIPVFSKKSFSLNGKLKDEELQKFLNRPYDLVLNYYTKGNVYLNYVSAMCKGSLKVGLTESQEDVNNLVLKVEEKEYGQFTDELVKYLKILKRL